MWTKGLGAQSAMFGGSMAFLAVFTSVRSSAAAGLLIVPFAALILALSLAGRYARARSDVYGPKSAAIFDDPRTMEITDASITTRTEGGLESTVPWSHFGSATRRGGFTFLYFSRIGHFIVPDDAFRSEADREAFLTILRAQPFGRVGF